MIFHQLIAQEGILLVSPKGPLEAGDFEAIAREIDPYIEATGALRGLLLEAESFPGWSGFGALAAHLRFIRDHHRHVRRVALVSDRGLLSLAPHVIGPFVRPAVRHFDLQDRAAALEWLRS